MTASNPFPTTASSPGQGTVVLCPIPPRSSTISQLNYQYPLKLVAPSPTTSLDDFSIQTVYQLTYGGGLVAGDTVDLRLILNASTRLLLLTQGSTKIFKCPVGTRCAQRLHVNLAPGAGLCLLPDPVQPFAASGFTQTQRYEVARGASLCALDWVCRGREARGEDWDLNSYASRNDVWEVDGKERRLVLRDNLVLEPEGGDGSGMKKAMYGLGVYGTLILRGSMFEGLAAFFHEEFKAIPRLGARQWDPPDEAVELTERELARATRQRVEAQDGLLWTVATLKGCTVVKFGARQVEGGKKWLRSLLESEGSAENQFGERALLCLR